MLWNKKENRAGEKEVGVLKVEIDGFDFKWGSQDRTHEEDDIWIIH
jgi:hypothetical protein